MVPGLKMFPGPHSPTWESSGEPVLDVDRGAGEVPYKSIIGGQITMYTRIEPVVVLRRCTRDIESGQRVWFSSDTCHVGVKGRSSLRGL